MTSSSDHGREFGINFEEPLSPDNENKTVEKTKQPSSLGVRFSLEDKRSSQSPILGDLSGHDDEGVGEEESRPSTWSMLRREDTSSTTGADMNSSDDDESESQVCKQSGMSSVADRTKSRDTGLGESLEATSRLTSAISGDEAAAQLEMKEPDEENEKYNLGQMREATRRLRFFVRAYQAIKSSKSKEKKTFIDLGELAGLLGTIQKGPSQILDEEDKEDENIFRTFDPRQYRHNEEFVWPVLALEAIWKAPNERSAKDLSIIRSLMMGMHCFRMLPLAVKASCSKYVRLERCTRGRAIIRKGQRPENFFFLFAGTVNIVAEEEEESVYTPSKVLATLHKGDWFGGYSMALNSLRVVTAVSMEDCEFLVIDGDDFPLTGLGAVFEQELTERRQLLRAHPVLKSLSDEAIGKLVYETTTLHLEHDSIIVKNSHTCTHLYLFSQGFGSVMRWIKESEIAAPCAYPTIQKFSNETANLQHARAIVTSVLPMQRSSLRPILPPITQDRLKSELKSIHESKENLAMEYASYPAIGMPHRQSKSSFTPKKVSLSRSQSNGWKQGVYVTITNITAGSCFGLPEVLSTMKDSLQLISSKAVVISIPESTIHKYFTEPMKRAAKMSFSEVIELCDYVTDKLNNSNSWQGFKNRLMEDVHCQRDSTELKMFDMSFQIKNGDKQLPTPPPNAGIPHNIRSRYQPLSHTTSYNRRCSTGVSSSIGALRRARTFVAHHQGRSGLSSSHSVIKSHSSVNGGDISRPMTRSSSNMGSRSSTLG